MRLLLYLGFICSIFNGIQSFKSIGRYRFEAFTSSDVRRLSSSLAGTFSDATIPDSNRPRLSAAGSFGSSSKQSAQRILVDSFGSKLMRSMLRAILILLATFFHLSIADADTSMLRYTAEDRSYTFLYPSSFEVAPKLVKTHKDEIFLRSKDISGYSLGLAVSIP